MKPAPFEYFSPQSLEEALDLLQHHGFDAKLLAGGQSLIPVMNFRLAQPSVIVDLNGVKELDYVRPDDSGGLRLGAMVRQSRLEHSAAVAERAPLVHEAMPFVAHPQIRNRGTLGGSLAHADPASELPAIMVALQARMKVQGPRGDRGVRAEEFYLSLFTVALEPDEILVEVDLPPLPPLTGTAFEEFSRRHGDYALAGVAAVVTLDEDGVCRQARLVFLNVGEKPVSAHDAAGMLQGHRMSPALIDEACQHAAQREMNPTGDIHASAAFKRHLAHVLGRRALKRALLRAGQAGIER